MNRDQAIIYKFGISQNSKEERINSVIVNLFVIYEHKLIDGPQKLIRNGQNQSWLYKTKREIRFEPSLRGISPTHFDWFMPNKSKAWDVSSRTFPGTSVSSSAEI